MSEMSTAFAMFKKALHKFSLSAESLAVARAAFKSGWEAREILLNKRVAEIEKAATMKERERCAIICDGYAENSRSPSNFSENCATAIRSAK